MGATRLSSVPLMRPGGSDKSGHNDTPVSVPSADEQIIGDMIRHVVYMFQSVNSQLSSAFVGAKPGELPAAPCRRSGPERKRGQLWSTSELHYRSVFERDNIMKSSLSNQSPTD